MPEDPNYDPDFSVSQKVCGIDLMLELFSDEITHEIYGVCASFTSAMDTLGLPSHKYPVLLRSYLEAVEHEEEYGDV